MLYGFPPGEFGGTYYRLMPEGMLANFDGFTVKVNPDLEGLDLSRWRCALNGAEAALRNRDFRSAGAYLDAVKAALQRQGIVRPPC